MIVGTEARQQLVLDNLGMVRVVLRELRAKDYEYRECFQAGALGLLLAAERFDTSREVKFATYARFWVKKEVIGYRLSRPVVTRPLDSLFKRPGETTEAFKARVGRMPKRAEYELETRPAEMGNPEVEDGSRGIIARLMDEAGLDERERAIVGLYHGLDGEPMDTTQISKSAGFSSEWVRTLLRKAENRMRRVALRPGRLRDDIVNEMGWAS